MSDLPDEAFDLSADDSPREECGVFGIFGHTEAANLTYLGLYALQHRGQESAGIATSDGFRLRVSRSMAYVNEAFDEATLGSLVGSIAVGHVRYSTAGESRLANAGPLVSDSIGRKPAHLALDGGGRSLLVGDEMHCGRQAWPHNIDVRRLDFNLEHKLVLGWNEFEGTHEFDGGSARGHVPPVIEAINRELERGGQVFFVHNRVYNIELIAARIRNLVPEAEVGIGHGQMHEDQLEHRKRANAS